MEEKLEKRKMTTRINKVVYERVELLAKQNNVYFQDMVNELLELGILKLMEGGLNEKIQYKRN